MHDHGDQGMDELTAHLDRAWDLLDRSDLHGAEQSARQALELEPESPEGLTLLGIVAAQDGNPEQALDRFQRAIELDPEYVEPYLHAAETAWWQLEDAEEALRLVEEALDRAEEDEEYLDALLLKIEVLLATGEEEREAAARAALAEVPAELPDDASLRLRAGHICLDLGDLAAAERHYQATTAVAPDCADAWYGLGRCAEERDDLEAQRQHWLKARELDVAAERPPWALPEADFEGHAEKALAELPPRIRDLLANVPIMVADYPDADLVRDGFDPRMLGFFSGVPYPEQRVMGGPAAHLDCILLFTRNIERVAHSVEDVREELRITLLHETGHFFALDEEELERLGLG